MLIIKLCAIICHYFGHFYLSCVFLRKVHGTKMPNMHLVRSCFVSLGHISCRSMLVGEFFIQKQKIDFGKWRLAAKYFQLFSSFYFMLLKTKELKIVERIF